MQGMGKFAFGKGRFQAQIRMATRKLIFSYECIKYAELNAASFVSCLALFGKKKPPIRNDIFDELGLRLVNDEFLLA